jgi:hypothetical protein
MRIWGFHSLPTTSERWQSYDTELAVAGNPLSLATWKALVPTMGSLKSPTGNWGLVLGRLLEAAPTKVNATSVLTLASYPDWGFPCFSSVVRQMPGYNWKRGHDPLPTIMEALSQNAPPPPKSHVPSTKAIPSLWVQLPDIHPSS